jgi:alpha-methylacyl-CoA racemase
MKDVGAWNSKQGENLLDGGAPFYSLYKCKDTGQYFTIAGIEMKFWANTMAVMKEKCGLTEEHFEYFTDS